MHHPVPANTVADYLLWLAAHEDPEEPTFLTNLQFQKLLYYVQGWTLADWGRPMFAEPLEAWPQGPVVHDVWKRFSPYGKRPITDEIAEPERLTPDERDAIRAVWDAYKQYSAPTLRDMTHEDEPWRHARAA